MLSVIITPFPFGRDRGSPVRARRLTRLARGHGIDAHVLTFRVDGDRPAWLHSARLPLPLPPRAGLTWQKVLCDLELLVRSVVFCLRHRPPVIEGHLHDGLAFALLCRALSGHGRVVYNAHGTLGDELVAEGRLQNGGTPHRLVRWIERALERRADHVLVQSEHRRREVIAGGVDPSRVSVLPDAPESTLFDVERTRANGVVRCVYTGSLAPYQGADDLLHAATLTTGIEYVMFGGPSEGYPAMARALAVHDRVRFIDPAPFDRLPEVLASADIAVAPRRYGGNIPGKLPAYQAAGLPTVGTDVPGVTELVDATTGVIVPPADPTALADALQRLADDPVSRERMGAAARERATAAYSEEALIGAVRKAYGCVG